MMLINSTEDSDSYIIKSDNNQSHHILLNQKELLENLSLQDSHQTNYITHFIRIYHFILSLFYHYKLTMRENFKIRKNRSLKDIHYFSENFKIHLGRSENKTIKLVKQSFVSNSNVTTQIPRSANIKKKQFSISLARDQNKKSQFQTERLVLRCMNGCLIFKGKPEKRYGEVNKIQTKESKLPHEELEKENILQDNKSIQRQIFQPALKMESLNSFKSSSSKCLNKINSQFHQAKDNLRNLNKNKCIGLIRKNSQNASQKISQEKNTLNDKESIKEKLKPSKITMAKSTHTKESSKNVIKMFRSHLFEKSLNQLALTETLKLKNEQKSRLNTNSSIHEQHTPRQSKQKWKSIDCSTIQENIEVNESFLSQSGQQLIKDINTFDSMAELKEMMSLKEKKKRLDFLKVKNKFPQNFFHA